MGRGKLFTPEERARGLEKRLISIKEKQDLNLRKDFLDSDNWALLSKNFGIRLPQWNTPCSTSGMHKFLKKLNISLKDYRFQFGKEKDFIQYNLDWPLRAWAGLVLEYLDENN